MQRVEFGEGGTNMIKIVELCFGEYDQTIVTGADDIVQKISSDSL